MPHNICQTSSGTRLAPTKQRWSRRKARGQEGLTLLEIIVAVFLIAIAFSIAIPSFNAVTHVRLRKSATRVAATIRYLYNQAALKGLCMRMVFNLKGDTFVVEASTNGECLIENEQLDARSAKKQEKDKIRKEKEKKNSDDKGTTDGGWSGEKPISLKHKKTVFALYNDYLIKPRQLPQGVRIHGVYTIHQKEMYSRKVGPSKAFLHCFPLGRCERGVIYLEDASGTILSLEIKPMTGRVVIHEGKLPLSDRFKDPKKGADDDS